MRLPRATARAAIIALCLGAFACSMGEKPEASSAVTTTELEGTITRGEFERRAFLSGELDAVNSVDIVVPQTDSWQLTISWLIEDGTAVKKGDRIVEFDNSAFTGKLESQRVLVKQADRDFATQRHLRAMTVADKENAVRVAKLEREKAALLAGVEKDLISERTYQERQLALERAESTLRTAEADLKSATRAANLDLKVKRVSTEKAKRTLATAESSIAALTVTAPEDGVAMVGSHPWMGTKILAGDTVQPGWTVVRLPDLSGLSINARLSDVDDGRIAVGMEAQVFFDAVPASSVRGTVKSISAVAREQAGDSLLRAFDVEISLDDDGGKWTRPGMSARVEVLAHRIEDALLAPRGALSWRDGKTTLDILGAAEREVTIIDCNARVCAIEGDVAAGTAVRIGGAR